MATRSDAPSMGDLFSRLAADGASLMRQEVRLAKIELGEKAAQAGKQLGLMALGGGVAHAGILAVVAALVLLIGQFVAMWLSAFLVGVVVLAAGYLIVRAQLTAFRHFDPIPKATVATFKEDKDWIKEQIP
jgi:uncharacterized membrane protein YqjE